MPQMAPALWLNISLFMFALVVFVISYTYFTEKQSVSSTAKTLSVKKMLWKW